MGLPGKRMVQYINKKYTLSVTSRHFNDLILNSRHIMTYSVASRYEIQVFQVTSKQHLQDFPLCI